jgi:putative endonuclease
MARDFASRQRAEQRGHKGETMAVWWLRLKGYRIIARRFKTKLGEVDIIARRRDVVAMVEVKARATLLEAMDAVDHSTMRRIEAAGDLWLAKQRDHARLNIRYDLIAILPRKLPVHVESLFHARGR